MSGARLEGQASRPQVLHIRKIAGRVASAPNREYSKRAKRKRDDPKTVPLVELSNETQVD